MAAEELDHKSAVCFVPPRELWDDPIQEIRCFNDKAFVRWPPHINLLYPFWKDTGDNFAEAARKLRRCLETLLPFRIAFENFSLFNHGNTCTVWLEPRSENLQDLQMTLTEAFPECHHLSNDPSRDIHEFVPHLAIGQWPNERLAREAITRLSMNFKPMEMQLDHVVILHRRAHQTPFEFKVKIPLGASSDDAIEKINVGYVASLGASDEMKRDHPFGLGSYAHQGVWNFAYGANVNQEKMISGRRITPLESLPGMLEGYRLTFNHQGGMGNVEPMTPAAAQYFQARGIHGVHGILHRLTRTDFARLSNMESGYRPVEVDVHASDGRGMIEAVVFITPKNRSVRDGLAPPDRYHNLILRGAKEWNLNRNYVSWLESLECIPFRSRGPLYWRTPEGVRISDRIIRVGADPPPNRFRRFRRHQSA